MRGRRPSGPGYVATLDGSPEAKSRLEVILRTLSGEMRVSEACAILGVGESRFNVLRRQALQAALDRLAPRPPGRPAPPRADPRLAGLEQQEEKARQEAEAARIREAVALVLPALAAKAAEGKRRSRRKGRSRH